MESCRVVWKQCLSWVHCCILKLAIIYVAYDPLYQQMNLGWPFDWFWFCLDLFTAFMFVAVCTLDFYIARSLKPFLFWPFHMVWSQLAVILCNYWIKLTMISWFIKAEVRVICWSNFTCYCALPECSYDRPIRFFVSLMNSNTSVVD